MSKIFGGHEGEIAALKEQEASPEFRALAIRGSGRDLAEAGEVLRLAALGRLSDRVDLFGETVTPAEQVQAAEATIANALRILKKYANSSK